MKRELQGQSVIISTTGEKARAFIPAPLPPSPSIDWTPNLRSKFDQALLALGRLDGISTIVQVFTSVGGLNGLFERSDFLI